MKKLTYLILFCLLFSKFSFSNEKTKKTTAVQTNTNTDSKNKTEIENDAYNETEELSILQGGFIGPRDGLTSIEAVNSIGVFQDDVPVALTGYIKKSLSDTTYLFFDYTGSIVIEIQPKEWEGYIVTPKTKIVVYGRVQNEIYGKSIDVDYIRIAN